MRCLYTVAITSTTHARSSYQPIDRAAPPIRQNDTYPDDDQPHQPSDTTD